MLGLALGALWLPVIWLLGAQWSIYEQYNYGWAVPFLCLYLLWRRTNEKTTERQDNRTTKPAGPVVLWSCGLVLLALLPTRILQEANPLWRFASYALAGEAVVITLALVFFCGGRRALRHLAFPIVFFLVAVPWPTPVEGAIINSLTRLNTVSVIEIMNGLGVAALAHGNVIEVSTGLLGIDEACSGIRSTQVVFMLALFFGELCRLRLGARVALMAGALAIAMLLNIARTSILVGWPRMAASPCRKSGMT